MTHRALPRRATISREVLSLYPPAPSHLCYGVAASLRPEERASLFHITRDTASGTGRVGLEDVAKEVGQAPTTRATHILVIANGRFTKDAERFAQAHMRASALTIFLCGTTDFEAVEKSPGSLGTILRDKADTIVRHRAAEARESPKP